MVLFWLDKPGHADEIPCIKNESSSVASQVVVRLHSQVDELRKPFGPVRPAHACSATPQPGGRSTPTPPRPAASQAAQRSIGRESRMLSHPRQ